MKLFESFVMDLYEYNDSYNPRRANMQKKIKYDWKKIHQAIKAAGYEALGNIKSHNTIHDVYEKQGRKSKKIGSVSAIDLEIKIEDKVARDKVEKEIKKINF